MDVLESFVVLSLTLHLVQIIAEQPIKVEHRQLILKGKLLADTMETICFFVTHSDIPPQHVRHHYVDSSLKMLLVKHFNPKEQRVTLRPPEFVSEDKLQEFLCRHSSSQEAFLLIEVRSSSASKHLSYSSTIALFEHASMSKGLISQRHAVHLV